MSFFPSVTIWRWLPTTERVINRGGARMRQTLMAPANFIFNPPQQSFPEKENIINFYSGCWSIFAKYSWGCSSKKLAAIMLTEESFWLWRSILISLFELMYRRQHRFFFRNWGQVLSLISQLHNRKSPSAKSFRHLRAKEGLSETLQLPTLDNFSVCTTYLFNLLECFLWHHQPHWTTSTESTRVIIFFWYFGEGTIFVPALIYLNIYRGFRV